MNNILLIFIVFFPLLGGVIAATFRHNARNAEAWLAGFVAIACFISVLLLYPQIAANEIIRYQMNWAPALGLSIYFRMDGFAWLMCALATGIGALVVLYARYYMSPADPVPRFFAFLLAFMSAMLGLVLSGNLLQLVVFWEFTSILSFMLISYWYHRSDARNGARMAFTITGGGGLCLFAGVLLIGQIVGSYDLDTVLAQKTIIQQHSLYLPALILIVIGALTKSAQFPFQFWLPNAMAAPTPVSAFLHSATMVKAGVFLLARLWPVLAGTEEWFWLVGGAGLTTLLLGAFTAMFQTDLKGVLAYSTISHLGLITFLLGMNRPLALVAGLLHLISHATFKASLFMAAGIVDHETGTRDIRKLSGLYKKMPLTTTLAIVAAAAMAGVPLLNGFISKEMFFAEANALFDVGAGAMLIPIAAVIAGTFSVAYSLRFIGCVFFGPTAQDLPLKPHDPPLLMLVPSACLVIICFIVGIFPHWALGSVLMLAGQSILGEQMPEIDLALWHGFNVALFMSICTLIFGISLYLIIRKYFANFFRWIPYLRIRSSDIFYKVVHGFHKNASRVRQRMSSHRLQTQILIIILATLIFIWEPLSRIPSSYVFNNIEGQLSTLMFWWHDSNTQRPFLGVFVVLWIGGFFSSIAAAYYAKHNRLKSLIALSMVGLAVCATFVLLSAPDLALTQLVVEAATILLLLLGLRWLPQRQPDWTILLSIRTVSRRTRDFIIACAIGLGMSLLAFTMLTYQSKNTLLPDYFLSHAIPEGKGTNVVNVLLVDFRGFDTFGEVMVLIIVALSIYAVLKRFRPIEESIFPPYQQRLESGVGGNLIQDKRKFYPHPPFLIQTVLGRIWYRVSLLIALYFLLRGHNLPGGGFIGGLVFSLAIVMQYLFSGSAWIQYKKPFPPIQYMSIGMLIIGIAGISSWWVEQPFLSAFYWTITITQGWSIQIPSVLIFDIGVFLVVIGATVMILSTLAHQSIRSKKYQAQFQEEL